MVEYIIDTHKNLRLSFWRTAFNKVVLIKIEAFKEAAEYSNIGINKIAEMLRNPMCNFVLFKSEDEFFFLSEILRKIFLNSLKKRM